MTAHPPVAPRHPLSTTRHGETLEDAYAWLRDDDWQRVMREPEALAPEIRTYLEAENAYTEAVLAPVAGLRERLFEEMKGRIKEDDASVPAPDGPWAYYLRYVEGGQYPVFCRRPRGKSAGEEVLLDGNREGAGEPFFKIVGWAHSPDHRYLAYTADLKGSELYTLRIRDLAAGCDLPDRVEDARGDFAWANDGRSIVYTRLDADHRPSSVYRHVVGETQEKDALVYEESDPGFYLFVDKTEDRRFILVAAHDHSQTSEVRCVDADAPERPPFVVSPRERGIEYDVTTHGERFLIRTNADGAVDFKIVEAPLDARDRGAWRDLVAHRPGRVIRALHAFAGHLVRLEREDGLPRIAVTSLADGREHAISFDEEAFDLSVLSGYEFDTDTLRFGYSSLATPQQVYDYDMERRVRVLRKEQEIPSGHDPLAYVTRRVFARSHDGTRVPVSLLYRRDTRLDGSAPVLLYGYGSYGLSIPDSFSPNRFSLVDRGFIYAIAHIRGGTEMGYGWYLDGKLGHKKNTFHDFIAAAEHLIAEGFTRRGGIAAHGGSAGGLLMGAVANMRPDLFRAVVADVPFVDVLNTMCDGTLPLTPPEWEEWGNPIEDAAAYRYIRSYSPYENVAAQDYPAILATTGLTDPRVTYWEPAKWVARLRATATGGGPILLRTNMQAGHGGAAGRFDRLDEQALVYAFVLQMLGRADAGEAQAAGSAASTSRAQ